MDIENLKNTTQQLANSGKGILAADESSPTIAKRFASINLESTENNRRDYRQHLFSTDGLGEFVSGVILFEETLKQQSQDGAPLPELLTRQGIVPGIKVDKGLVRLSHASDEQVTQGLDGLALRLQDYKQFGARFAKWRAVFQITENSPTNIVIKFNAANLARYAAICQDQEIVPIVEPEILMDGNHSIDVCAEVTEEVLHTVFNALHRHHVLLEYMVLKPNMVIPGTDHPDADPAMVASKTLQVLYRTVPAAVPSINFLSGGQNPVEATANLNAMNAASQSHPWQLSFSYGRALQEPALSAWAGENQNTELMQKALHKRVKLNASATLGQYTDSMEGDY